jgi:ABC-type arginine transport system permease subunit
MLNVEFSFFDIYTTIVLMNPEYLFVCLIEYGQKFALNRNYYSMLTDDIVHIRD